MAVGPEERGINFSPRARYLAGQLASLRQARPNIGSLRKIYAPLLLIYCRLSVSGFSAGDHMTNLFKWTRHWDIRQQF